MTISEGKLKRMKALSNARGAIAAAAMDQRGSLKKSLAAARGVGAKDIAPAMMSEFKTVVSRVLTPRASAILLDPEFGLEAAKARSANAGLLLAYELSGYDNTQPGRLPDLLPNVSVKRLVDWGADAVKILIYYTYLEDPAVNDVKHAFIERVGAECETYDIPFFLEFVGYDPRGGDEKGLEYARVKPQIVRKSMEEFSKPQYKVDAARLLTHRAAAMKDAGMKTTLESSMAKLYSSEVAVRCANECVQIHGGYGFIKDYPAEKFYRDVKLCTIGEGTSEIQRLVIARQLLKD